jgi:hypothetical protein
LRLYSRMRHRKNMEIKKAMDLLTQDLQELGERKSKDLRDAQKLGIQALRRIYEARKYRMIVTKALLVGETAE